MECILEKTEAELRAMFDLKLDSRGQRRHDPALLPAGHGLRKMLEAHQRNAETWLANARAKHTPKMYPVHFGYVESFHINAFAFTSQNYGFVAVYSGAITALYRFFTNMLASARFLKRIGNPDLEEEWTGYPHVPLRTPKDPRRAMFSGLLITCAIDFLFWHEIAHIMNGHVDFLNATTGLTTLAELTGTVLSEENNLTRQSLEMDADSFATGQGLYNAFGNLAEPGRVSPDGWREWYSSPELTLFTWVLAIYGFFRIFFGGATRFDALLQTQHPPDNIRLRMVILTLVEFLKRRGEDNLIPTVNSMLNEVANTTEHFCALFSAVAPDPTGIQEAFDPRATQHIDVLLNHWKTLRPNLLPFARGGGLAE
jgi:hypothetical protein